MNNERFIGKEKKVKPLFTLGILGRLFATPALMPLGIAFFAAFIALTVAVYAAGGAIMGSAGMLAAMLIPVIINAARTVGAGYAVAAAGGIVAAIGVLGLISTVTLRYGSELLRLMLKGASGFIKVNFTI